MRILFLILTSFLPVLLLSQNLPNKFYSEEKINVVFKLSESDLLELAQKGLSQKFILNFNPREAIVGKYNSLENNNLNEGNYLIVSSNYKTIYFTVKTNNNYSVQSFKLKKERYYWLKDRNHQLVKDWILFFNGKTIKSDSMGLVRYTPINSLKYGIARIKNESVLVSLNINSGSRSRNNYNGSKTPKIEKGAILLSKPVYKPGDTIKFKAYLFNNLGRPQRRKTRFIIYSNQSIYGEIISKPNKNGTFEGSFFISDSFPINKTYTIRAISGNKIKSSPDFQIKNYELKLYRPEWGFIPKLLLYKEDLVLNPVLLDANDNLVFDGSVQVKIKTSRPKGFLENKLIFDQNYLNEYLDTTIGLDQLAGSPITIKNELLPNFNCELLIEIKINTNDGNVFKSSYISVNRSFQTIEVTENNNEIYCYSLNNKSLDTSLEATIKYKDKTVETRKFSLPISFDSLSLIEEIYFSYWGKDNIEQFFVWQSKKEDPLICNLTDDSLSINIKKENNEVGILFIYDKNKLIHKHFSGDFDTTLYLGVHNSYTVLYYSFNSEKFYKKSYNRNKKQIRLEHNLEEIIYPGKEIPVVLNLKDGYNIPLKNYEFSAFAWNNQMEEIRNHDFQIKPSDNYQIDHIQPSKTLSHNEYEFPVNPEIEENYFRFFLLDSLDNRRSLVYNSLGYDLRYFESKGNYIVFNNLNKTSPEMIWANGIPILNNLSSVSQNLIIPIKKGVYTIKILDNFEIYEIKGVEIKENQLCILTYDNQVFSQGNSYNIAKSISKFKLNENEKNKILNNLSQNLVSIKLPNNLFNYYPEIYSGDKSFYYIINKHMENYELFFYNSPIIYLRVNNREFELDFSAKNQVEIQSLEPFQANYSLVEISNFYYIKGLSLNPILNSNDSKVTTQNKPISNPWDSLYDEIIGFINNTINEEAVFESQRIFIKGSNRIVEHAFLLDLLNPYMSFYINYGTESIYVQDGGKYKLVQLSDSGEISEMDIEITKYKDYYVNNNFANWKKIDSSFLNKLYYYFFSDDSVDRNFNDIEISNGYEKHILFDKGGKNKLIIKTEEYKNISAYVQLVENQKIVYQAPTYNKSWVEFRIQENTNYQLQIIYLGHRKLYKEPIKINKGENLIVQIFQEDYNWINQNPEVKRGNKTIQENNLGPVSIKGVVKDKDTREPIGFAAIIIYKEGVQVGGTVSDLEGNFTFRNLTPGKYDLNIQFVGYSDYKLTGVKVSSNVITGVNVYLTGGVELQAVAMVYRQKNSLNLGAIKKIPTRNKNNLSNSTNGLLSSDQETISFRGSRANGTAYYINGVRVIERISTEQNAYLENMKHELETYDETGTSLNADEEKQRLENLIGKTHIRTNFKDLAFWLPSLKSNKQGIVAFTIKYPDNISSWTHYFMGVNSKGYVLNYDFVSKSYLPISSQLILPKLLIVGDSLLVKTRSINYTGAQHPARLFFSGFGIKDSVNINLDRIDTSQFWVYNTFNTGDSIELKIKLNNGFEDGERKLLKSQEQGLRYFSDRIILLKDSEKFKNKFIEEGNKKNYEILIYNNWTQIIERNIQLLKEYNYGCVEQTASKLRALLYEEQLRKFLNQDFNESAQIRSLIRKLNKLKNKDNLWGWWQNNPSNFNMSLYVLKVFSEAKQLGYSVGDLEESFQNLKVVNSSSSISYKLELLELEHILGIKKDSVTLSFLNEDFNNLNLMDLIRLAKIKHYYGLSFDDQKIFNFIKYDSYNLPYLGEDLGSIFLESNQLSINLIEYLGLKEDRPGLTDSLKLHLILKGEERLNTLDRAQLLSVLFKNLKSSNNKLNNLLINGSAQAIKNSYKLSDGDEVEITGQNAFYGHSILIIRHQNLVKEEVLKQKGVEINPLDSLERELSLFDEINLGVQIQLQETKDYLMLEIPVPAGIWVDFNKISGDYISHKEQYDDRIIIYYLKLNKGSFKVNIPARVIFKGTFTRNPSLLSSMYDSEYKASNRISKIRVR